MDNGNGYRDGYSRPREGAGARRAIPEVDLGAAEGGRGSRAAASRASGQGQASRPQGASPQGARRQGAQVAGDARGAGASRGQGSQQARNRAASAGAARSGNAPREGQARASHARSQSQAQSAARRQDPRQRQVKKKVANDVEIVYPEGYRPIKRDDPSREDYVRSPYRSRRDEDAESSRSIFRILLVILASIIYWPMALIGVISPFMEGFNPGTLAMWQVVFSRFWLAFVLLGAIYALVINLGGIRDSRRFRGRRKWLKIVLFVLADFAVSFVVIRIICLF